MTAVQTNESLLLSQFRDFYTEVIRLKQLIKNTGWVSPDELSATQAPTNGNGHAANGNSSASVANGNGGGGGGGTSTGAITMSLGATKVSFQTQADAPSCAECGSIMVRNGSCYKCLNCGSTSGCS